MSCLTLVSGCGRTAFSSPRVHGTARPAPLTTANAIKIGPGKKWEHYKLNKKGKPIVEPLHVKTGDTVVVIAGEDRGKTGKVTKVYRKTKQVFMDGVNVSVRHLAPDAKGEPGQRIKKEAPIAASNVMHWSEKEQTRSKLGRKFVDGTKVRYLKKTGEVLDN
jgi:large subunit ribosomal protein L24